VPLYREGSTLTYTLNIGAAAGCLPKVGLAWRGEIRVPDDLYDVLGVGRSATPTEIRHAYLTRIRSTHPDINPTGEDEAKALTLAYVTLSDAERRRLYDQSRVSSPCPIPLADHQRGLGSPAQSDEAVEKTLRGRRPPRLHREIRIPRRSRLRARPDRSCGVSAGNPGACIECRTPTPRAPSVLPRVRSRMFAIGFRSDSRQPMPCPDAWR